MMVARRHGLHWLAMAVTLLPRTAGAQTIARSFEELQRLFKPGPTVVVTDLMGRRTTGRVVDLSESSLVLEPRGEGGTRRTFAESSVAEIRRTDSAWSGTLIGLAVGIGLAKGLCEQDWELCRGASVVGAQFGVRGLPVNGSHVFGPLMLSALIGGPLAGGLIDRAKGNNTIYLARSRSSQSSVAVSPWHIHGGGGMSVAFRF